MSEFNINCLIFGCEFEERTETRVDSEAITKSLEIISRNEKLTGEEIQELLHELNDIHTNAVYLHDVCTKCGRRMKSKHIVNRYRVEIPIDAAVRDFVESGQLIGAAQDARHMAIDEERARLYCMPAEWSARLIKTTACDYVLAVTRTRNRKI